MTDLPARTEQPQAIFSAGNNHYDSCGAPPAIRGQDYKYAGYFQNELGEQWVLTLDASGRITLRGGEIGWDNSVDLTHGGPMKLVLSDAESLWLAAVLGVARAVRRLREGSPA